MTHDQGIALARRYRDLLIQEGIPVRRVYLFGSVVRGEATEDSDIDVAVVCEPFKAERMEETLALWRTRRKVDVRIEPLCLHPGDFDGPFSVAQEIRQTGIEV